MSKWLTGKELVEKLNIKDFELIEECIKKGIYPHNKVGKPMTVNGLLERATGLQEKVETIQALDDDYFRPMTQENFDENTWDSNTAEKQQLGKEIADIQERLQGYDAIEWEYFEMPDDEEMALAIMDELLNAHYQVDEVFVEEAIQHPEPNIPSPKPHKLRPEQRHKEAVRKIAEQKWREEISTITIADFAVSNEVSNACEGKMYNEETIRNWVKDLCPNRNPGRRPKK